MSDSSPTIICYEMGSDEPPWTGSLESVHDDLDILHRLNDRRVIGLSMDGNHVEITGTDRVGLILLPSGRRLSIRSKVKSLVLLEWLVLVGEFPNIQHWIQDHGVSVGDDLPECLARLFLLELEKLTKNYLRREYMPVTSSSSTVRGRIQTTQLHRQLQHLPQIPIRYRTQTLDTPANMVLALALDRLPVLLPIKSLEDARRLSSLQDQWAGIRRVSGGHAALVAETQWARPPGYASALQLARLILMGASPTDTAGHGGQVFTVSMASIWERGIRKVFEGLASATGWSCAPSSDRTRAWDDSVNTHDPNRWLTVDILLSREGKRWALDTKYKTHFGHEHRNDRFQMCAYALAFNASKATLIYPTAQTVGQHRTLLHTTVGNVDITVDSIELPMWMGPSECRKCLATYSQPSLEQLAQ